MPGGEGVKCGMRPGWLFLSVSLLCGVLVVGVGPGAMAQRGPFVGAPMQPLLAWDVAPDGSLFVLDATHRIYRLNGENLAPIDQSPPLTSTLSDRPASLIATENRLYVSGGALTETHVLEQSEFRPVTTLDKSGLLALDPDHRLFVLATAPTAQVPREEGPGVWYYDLSNPHTAALLISPAVRGVESLPQGLATDPVNRRLYVRMRNAGSPPHQGNYFDVYELDTLERLDSIGGFGPGATTDPIVTGETGILLFGYTAQGGYLNSSVMLTDLAGNTVLKIAPMGALPFSDGSGDWIYLLRERGLWALKGEDFAAQENLAETFFSLESVLPFVQAPPTDLRFSPDGEILYLLGNGWLAAYPVGALQALGMAPVTPLPIAWNPFSPEAVSARYFPSPQIEQDGTAFALVDGYGELYQSLDAGKSWRFNSAFSYPYFAYVRHLSLSPTFAEDNTVMASPTFTAADSLRSEDGGESWGPWQAPFAFVRAMDGNRDVYIVQDGEPHRLTAYPAADETPAWSPAWTHLAFQSNRGGNWDIYTIPAGCVWEGGELAAACAPQQLTGHPGDDLLPAWSPDGRQIAFVSTRDGNPEIYVMDADGDNQRRLTFHDGGDWRPAWLPDSERIAFVSDREGNNDIFMLRVPGPDQPFSEREPFIIPIVQSPADDRDPAVGGAGKMLFLSNREGVMQPYIVDLNSQGVYADYTEFPVERFAALLDTPAGHPAWLEDGRVLLVLDEDIYVVEQGDAPDQFELLFGAETFDGHPAGSPVWWRPDPASSRNHLVK